LIKSAAFGVGLQIVPSLLAFYLFYLLNLQEVDSKSVVPFYIVGLLNLIKGFGEFGIVRSFTTSFASTGKAPYVFHLFFSLTTTLFIICEIILICLFVNGYLGLSLFLLMSLGLLLYFQLFDALLISLGKEKLAFFFDALFYSGFYLFGIYYFGGYESSSYYNVLSIYITIFFIIKVFFCYQNNYNLKLIFPINFNKTHKEDFIDNLKISVNLVLFKQVDRFVLLSLMPSYYIAFVNVFNQFFNKICLFGTYYSRLMLVVFSEKKSTTKDFFKKSILFESYILLTVLLSVFLKNYILQFLNINGVEYLWVYTLLLLTVSYNVCVRYYRAYIIGSGDVKYLVKVDFFAVIIGLFVGLLLFFFGSHFLYYAGPFLFFLIIYFRCFLYIIRNVGFSLYGYIAILVFHLTRLALCAYSLV